jgi:hypothetical protein
MDTEQLKRAYGLSEQLTELSKASCNTLDAGLARLGDAGAEIAGHTLPASNGQQRTDEPGAGASCGYYLADQGTICERCRTTLGTATRSTRRTTRALPGNGSRGCGGSIAVACDAAY